MLNRRTITRIALGLLVAALVVFLLGWALAIGCGLMGLCS